MSIADEIKKLGDLRSQGLITESEFQTQKAALLARSSRASKSNNDEAQPDWPSVPLLSKWWFQRVLTVLVIPAGLLVMLTRRSYERKRSGEVRPASRTSKLVLGGLATLVWGLGIATIWSRPVNTTDPQPKQIAACDSSDARSALANAVRENAARHEDTLRLLDVRNVTDVSMDEDGQSRRCNATLVLNTGEEDVGYELLFDLTGGDSILVLLEDPYLPETDKAPAPTETTSPLGQPYFAELGIQSRTSIPATSVESFIPSDPGVVPNVLAATELEPGIVVVLFATANTDEDCRACSPKLSIVWLRDLETAPLVERTLLNFESVGLDRRAPPSHPVTLPDGSVGFAIDVGVNAQGIRSSGCAIYEVTKTGARYRTDVSRPVTAQASVCR
jgi:Short C-terminal domain